MGNMSSALERFVRTGKSSFKDLAKSIIQDLLLIQLRAQMSGIFRMIGMAMGFPGANPLGASGYSDMATFTALLGAGGLANGGTAQAGDMHLVGERGPELFVPRVTGTVIPHEKLGGLGGGTTVTNYNINAIDVKSFEERIMGSSNAVWAANLYAQKRLPLGAGRM
jgi:phage-related minor tail protein